MRHSDYRRCSCQFRKAAARLAIARDSHVKLIALMELVSHFEQEIAVGRFAEINRILTAECTRQRDALIRNQGLKKVAGLLKTLAKEPACFRIRRSGWSAIAPGVKQTYRAGRRCFDKAKQEGTPEVFHQWRKRAKDLFYEVGLLQPVCPEKMSIAKAELEDLGECLGSAHDLFLLTERDTIKRLDNQAKKEAGELWVLVHRRQKELQARALAIGTKFYCEKPSAFCRRLGGYWKQWRHKR
jgi:CHAD domain-containing protein